MTLAKEVSFMTDSGQSIVISPGTIRQKADEVSALEKQAEAARKELNLLVAYLKAVGREEWVPSDLRSADAVFTQGGTVMITQAKYGSREGSWTGEIGTVLARYPEGATYAEIKAGLEDSVIGARLKSNPAGFYNGVDRLIKYGEAVKYKGRVFSTPHHEAFLERVRRGEAPDLSGEEGKQTVGGALVEVIDRHPEGITPGEIIAEANRLALNIAPNTVYNTLSKILLAERVRRDSGKYYPLNEMGRSQVTESSPDAGGAPTPPVENQEDDLLG